MAADATITSDYLGPVLSPSGLNTAKLRALRIIRAEPELRFDAIAFRGMSGALVAPLVAAALKKPLVLIRKEGEDKHSSSDVEGMDGFDTFIDNVFSRNREFTYIILDDFVDSGATITAIRKAMRKYRSQAKLTGIVVWKEGDTLVALRPSSNYSAGWERIRGRDFAADGRYTPEKGDVRAHSEWTMKHPEIFVSDPPARVSP